MKKQYKVILGLLVSIFAIWLSFGIFVIQPIGAIPKGLTVIYFRLGLNLPFISSPDGIVIDSGNELSLWSRLGAMASVAEPISKRTILRLDYSESLYLISTHGKTFER
jgi:hypothetical protein